MNRKLSGFLALGFWTAVWYLAAAAWNNPLLLPDPLRVLHCLGDMVVTAAFWQTAAASMLRILLGVACAVGLGTVLAVLTARSRLLHTLLAPAMTAMQATPVACFTILMLIWIDRDFVPVVICAMMGLPIVWSSVAGGIREVDPQLLEMARVYRLPKLLVLRRIWIPAVMPFFRTACLSSLGLGWKAGVAAEVLTVPKRSVGRMIMDAKLYVLTEELFAWTLVIILFSLLLQKLMQRLLRGRGNHA